MAVDTKVQFVTVSEGVTLATFDHGGTGPNLLLLHANGFDGRLYLPLVKALKPHFHLFSFDFRGHGLSGRAEGDFWRSYPEDTLNVVRDLSLEGCYVFGHSMGGTVALWAELLQPGTFRSICVFEPVLCSTTLAASADAATGAQLLSEIALKRRSTFPSRTAAIQLFKSKRPFSEFHPESLWCYGQSCLRERPDGSVELCCSPQTEATIFANFSHDAMRMVFPELPCVRCPLLVCCGADSGASLEYLPRAAQEVADAVQHARHVSFQLMDHMGPLTHPQHIAQHIVLCFRALTDIKHLPKYMIVPKSNL